MAPAAAAAAAADWASPPTRLQGPLPHSLGSQTALLGMLQREHS